MIGKEDGKLDFNKTALELHCLVRASYPWPKAFAFADGKEVLITGVWGGFEDLEAEEPLSRVSSDSSESVKPGTVVGFRKDRGIGVACADKTLWINGLQLPSKKELDHKAFVNGNRWILESQFS
jgi:methionyl-tRNA formyltransferase